jgi:dTDP-4-amino-4,6-dideoxygalactose transaminase
VSVAQERIPLVDLGAQLRPIRQEILDAVAGVLDSSRLFLGPNTAAFEEEFAAYSGATHAIGVGNGTDALHLALRAAGVRPGDEVITVSHSFFATAEAIAMAGAQPVFVDVEPRTLTMDPSRIADRITPRTRAIMPVHLYGQVSDMDAIMAVANQHGLMVIEDACQAHGAEYGGRRAGAIGHMGCFSFYFSKNLGAYGEAGAVLTSDTKLAGRLRSLRNHGSETRYLHETLGVNARIDEIQAAILRIKLRHLDAWNERRRVHARRYDLLLSESAVRRPYLPKDRSHVFHLYVIRASQRDDLRAALAEEGVETGVHYPVPIHLQPAARAYGYSEGDLPVTEQAAREVLSLPMYPELTDAHLQRVASAVTRATGCSPLPVRP